MGVSPISPSSSPCRRRRQAKRKKRGFSGTPRTPAKGRALCNPAYLSGIGRLRRRKRKKRFVRGHLALRQRACLFPYSEQANSLIAVFGACSERSALCTPAFGTFQMKIDSPIGANLSILSGIVKGGKPLTWGLGLCPNFLFSFFTLFLAENVCVLAIFESSLLLPGCRAGSSVAL